MWLHLQSTKQGWLFNFYLDRDLLLKLLSNRWHYGKTLTSLLCLSTQKQRKLPVVSISSISHSWENLVWQTQTLGRALSPSTKCLWPKVHPSFERSRLSCSIHNATRLREKSSSSFIKKRTRTQNSVYFHMPQNYPVTPRDFSGQNHYSRWWKALCQWSSAYWSKGGFHSNSEWEFKPMNGGKSKRCDFFFSSLQTY